MKWMVSSGKSQNDPWMIGGCFTNGLRTWALGTLPRDESVVATNAVAAGANFFSKAGLMSAMNPG